MQVRNIASIVLRRTDCVKLYQESWNVARKNVSYLPQTSVVQDRSLIEECRRYSFMSARHLKQASGVSGDVNTVRSRVKNANLRLFRVPRKEISVVCGKALPLQTSKYFLLQAMLLDVSIVHLEHGMKCRSHRIGHVTIHYWSGIYKDGSIHHINGQLNREKYLELLEVSLPEIRAREGDTETYNHNRICIRLQSGSGMAATGTTWWASRLDTSHIWSETNWRRLRTRVQTLINTIFFFKKWVRQLNPTAYFLQFEFELLIK